MWSELSPRRAVPYGLGLAMHTLCPITQKSVNLKESALIKSVFLKHLDEQKHAILLLAYSREGGKLFPSR